MSRQAAMWLLLGIIVTGTFLRSWELTARSLWFDEAFSWRLIQFPFSEMIDRAAADVHPPLYYVKLRGWSQVFGTSLLSLRSYSVALAAAAIAAAYGFTTYAFSSRRAGVLAAALLAFSGWQIAFAWEARMYTLGILLMLISSWILLAALRRPSPFIWLGYGIFAAAFAYTHYFAFFTLAAHALLVLGMLVIQTRWRVGEMLQSHLLWFAAGGALLAAALYAPWIPVLLQQNAQVQDAYWVPSVGGWSIPDTFYRMAFPTAGIPPHVGLLATAAVVPLLAVLCTWFLLSIAPHNRDGNALVVLSAAVPFLLAIATSFIGQSLYQDRFLVFANVFILIGIAALIDYLPRRWYRAVALALPVFLLITALQYWRELDIVNRAGTAAATAAVAGQHQGGEPLIVSSPFIYFSVLHYDQEVYNGALGPKLYSETGQLLHFAGGPILTAEDIIGPGVFLDERVRTLWLVDTTGFGGQKLELPEGWQTAQETSFPEVFGYQGEVFVRKVVR